MQMLIRTAAAAGLAALLLGAAPVRPANPMHMLNYLVGRWNCTSNAGGTKAAYTADYSYAMGGAWLRGINTSKGSTSEDLLGYSGHTWRVIDVEPTGTASVMEGRDTGLAHIAMHTKYPVPGLNVTFDRRSFRNYTLTFTGTMNGKPAKWQDVCTKA
jgi:hypothetical protein